MKLSKACPDTPGLQVAETPKAEQSWLHLKVVWFHTKVIGIGGWLQKLNHGHSLSSPIILLGYITSTTPKVLVKYNLILIVLKITYHPLSFIFI